VLYYVSLGNVSVGVLTLLFTLLPRQVAVILRSRGPNYGIVPAQATELLNQLGFPLSLTQTKFILFHFTGVEFGVLVKL